VSAQVLDSDAALGPEVPGVLADLSPTVVVVGDPMLDGWWCGTSDRMAREAPAPVVELGSRLFVPGGAANTAMNLVSLGARVRFVGAAGDDAAGRLLRDLLVDAGVDVGGLLLAAGVRTTTKDRVVVADQVLVRLDDGVSPVYPQEVLDSLADAAVAACEGANAVVVCDYGTGALVGPVRDALVSRAPRPPLCVVDAHDATPWAALAPDVVTPNAAEAERLVGGRLVGDDDGRAGAVGRRAETLLAATGASAVVVTLDRDGTATVARGSTGLVHRSWARPATEKQASGAGDTFVAALTLARACGLPLTTSVDLAQAAADVVVTRSGTSVCSTADLAGHLAGFAESALTHDELARAVAADRAAGRSIVFTNGCFDVLHRGHTAYLNQAKRLGDVLVVAINDDASTARLKGPGRPINPAHDRAGVLAALSCVDYVTVFDGDTAVPLLELLTPDVYAKGGDHTEESMVESSVVRAHGGEVRILDYLAAHSTSAVVRRIRGQQAGVVGTA